MAGRINWRRGFWRLWLAVSALWLLVIGYILRADLSIARLVRPWLMGPCPDVGGQATISLRQHPIK
jgi:hypothetical protein